MKELLQKENDFIENEQGVSIVTVLLILMLLTFIGIAATKTVINEKRSIRSLAVFEQSFYFAESATLEGVQKLENESTPEELLPANLTPLSKNRNLLIAAEKGKHTDDSDNLDVNDDGKFDKNDVALIEVSETDASTRRVVVSLPIPKGASLQLGQSRLYDYMSYGMTSAQGGQSMIKMGYRKRF